MKKPLHTKTLLSVIAGTAIPLLFPATLPASSSPGANPVTIDNFSFTPQTLTVRAGTKVTWVNKDDVPHTVTSVDKRFRSRALDTDEQFSFTFSAPGTYTYYCSVHPHMTGKIIVQ
ncbi:MAG TPA: cupredoxin family copper-binding protein [Candidatus Sulfotelmatobacter sp.]|nr:cupredoxin family copper-binding protein [Candidatus Sulfotelmatobacter sp.]